MFAYNVQTIVDAKNNIPIDYKVTNQNDSRAMVNMVQRAKSILGTNEFTALSMIKDIITDQNFIQRKYIKGKFKK